MHKTTETYVNADIIVLNHNDGSVKFVTLPEKLRGATMQETERYLSGELKFQMAHSSWMRNRGRVFRISNYDEEI